MKFGVMYANVGPFSEPDVLGPLAIAAEEAGMESLWTVEHVVVPIGYESKYPYAKSGKMPGPENSPIPDPLLSLAYVAALTKKIRLATGVLILPQRHPFYVAKEAATLDRLSGGRAILGIGVGWLEEEFRALGIPFEERMGRTRDAVGAIRSLWSEGAQPYEGKYFNWPAVESNPRPVQPGGVPIVIGGHTDMAPRRAARYCDGFFPARGDEPRLRELIAILHEECAKIGRDPSEIEITLPLPGFDVDAIRRYRDMGASRLVIPPPAFDPDGIQRGFEEFNNAIVKNI